MPNVLVAWLGKTDLRAPAESESVGQGPIAQALASRGFDEEFSRENADLAIAMTVALVRLAPRRDAQDTERDTKESS